MIGDIISQLPYELLGVIFAGATGVIKSIAFVKEGELGIKLRFGKAVKGTDGKPKIFHPGFTLMIPFAETLHRHHVRQQTINLNEQKIIFSDGMIFTVSAIVMFKIKNIYRALFEIEDVNNAIIKLGMALLREELNNRTHKELNDPEKLSTTLLEKIKNHAEEWGLEFFAFKLTDCAPTAETAQLVLAESGVSIKGKAIQKIAGELGISTGEINSQLAAVLLGVPLVTSISENGHKVK